MHISKPNENPKLDLNLNPNPSQNIVFVYALRIIMHNSGIAVNMLLVEYPNLNPKPYSFLQSSIFTCQWVATTLQISKAAMYPGIHASTPAFHASVKPCCSTNIEQNTATLPRPPVVKMPVHHTYRSIRSAFRPRVLACRLISSVFN